jgi:hypothetical protein
MEAGKGVISWNLEKKEATQIQYEMSWGEGSEGGQHTVRAHHYSLPPATTGTPPHRHCVVLVVAAAVHCVALFGSRTPRHASRL